VTKTDEDLSLESDRLEEKLEAATPEQPVVVIQYRNRGVSSWLFFPMMVVIPLGAILLYHRLVVQKYRVQAGESARLADNGIEAPRSGRSLPGSDQALPLAPGSQPNDPAQFQFGPFGSAGKPAPEAPAQSPAQPAAVPAPALSVTVGSSGTLPAGPALGAAQGAALLPAREPAPARSPNDPPKIAASAQPPLPADSSPADGGKKAGPRVRSVLPNPFAPDGPPPAPLPRRDGTGPADPGGTVATQPGVSPGEADAGSKVPEAGAESLVARAGDTRAGAKGQDNPAGKRLPSYEENMRQIEEEAAKKRDEISASVEVREAEIRSRRFTERFKFREELRQILRLHGKEAGPEIDKLSRRYGFDLDPDRFDQAVKTWRSPRLSLPLKVRQIRALDLPETVILNFLSDDLHLKVRSPNGPRNENEVRIKAARQLLSFEPPTPDPAPLPGKGAGPRPR